IIRPARKEEILNPGGTMVSVKLKHDPYQHGGLLAPSAYECITLHELCGRLAPALSSDLVTKEGDEPEQPCVSADDWKTIPGDALLRRLGSTYKYATPYGCPIEKAAAALRTI